ncbi:tubulin domain-containing protein [Cladorrhinum sp. PSN332]|nr:tubulin domain-containing protein [Cladorrhinum sp. PSN332]
MHEIITIQLGQRANYLATHFWNTQESYFTYSETEKQSPINHDVHFRPGISPADNKTETFTPRTLIYDLKGAFGSLRKINALYQLEGDDDPARVSQTSSLWHRQPVVQQNAPIPPSPYTAALDAGAAPPALTSASVKYFSDYSRVFYHPRSIVQLNEYEANPGGVMPFERYETGEELFKELDREHDLLDRDLRFFLEEADSMQGLQLFTGLDDAWGGFAARYTERVRDEIGGKTAVWVWGLEMGGGSGGNSGGGREKRRLRLGNKARALSELYKQASVVVPVAVPEGLGQRGGINVDMGSMWQTMGLVASAVESSLLATRLRDVTKRESMGSLADTLNTLGGQRIARLQMGWEKVEEEEEEGEDGNRDVRMSKRKLTEEELSEGVKLGIKFDTSDRLDHYGGRRDRRGEDEYPRVFSQVVGARGYDDDEEEPVEKDERGRRMRRSQYEPVTASWTTPLAFPILDSFPGVFRDEDDEPLNRAVNITTGLSADSSVYKRLKALRESTISSIAIEDRESLGNDLMEMADEYHEGWSSGSDDGEDD